MKLFFIVAILFIAINNYALDSLSVIKNLQNKFNTVQDFKSSFKQTTNKSFDDSELTLSGTFYYKKKNKFKIDLKNILLVSDGISIWNFDKRLNRVVINKIDENQSFLNLDDIINNYPELCTSNLLKENSDSKFYAVSLKPKNNNLEFESATLWIDKNYILTKIKILDSSGSEYFVELSNIKLNQNLSDAEFVFITPEACKVIDFR
ncbi:MAG: outer membrane lipoprotein carrier protein LolA [Bacteroidetes bacterium]|nr:outer membrane lipoprotein carrier protein LolA [Bacteroidota bacterium]